MNLFGKKKKEETAGCCCGGNCTPETMAQAENAKNEGASVKILGSGCAKCNQLEEATRAALEQLGMDTAVDHVTDFSQISSLWCHDNTCFGSGWESGIDGKGP